MRHPKNAADYAYNEQLLQKTLRSIENQSNDDYIVIIVGNQKPAFVLPERVRFVSVDFPPPARVNGPHADRDGFVRDKGTKIGVGLVAARDYSPEWVMIFDADDFIHRDLVEFVAREQAPGWIIDRGLIFSRARNGYRVQKRFHRTCGTSYVIPFDAYAVPEGLNVRASQEELLEAYGDVLPNIMGAHRNAVQWHKEKGRELRSLPFAGAVYHVDTGENHSGKFLPGVIRPWQRSLLACYAIESTRGSLETIWSCCGPQAVAESLGLFAKRVLRGVASRIIRFVRRGSRAR